MVESGKDIFVEAEWWSVVDWDAAAESTERGARVADEDRSGNWKSVRKRGLDGSSFDRSNRGRGTVDGYQAGSGVVVSRFAVSQNMRPARLSGVFLMMSL